MFNLLSKGVGLISNAVGKIKNFGHAVGKFTHTFASGLTPQATETPNLQGISKVCAIASDQAYNSQRLGNINDFLLDSELSNKNTAVYSNNSTVIIAFRGTAEVEDLKTDIGILKGTTSDIQFSEARNIYLRVKNKYPSKIIIATGHSKGGSLAIYLNKVYGIKAEVFNPGVGLDFLQSNPNKSNLQIYTIKGDPISALSGLSNIGNVRVFNSNTTNPIQAHSIKNFI